MFFDRYLEPKGGLYIEAMSRFFDLFIKVSIHKLSKSGSSRSVLLFQFMSDLMCMATPPPFPFNLFLFIKNRTMITEIR